MTNRMRCLSPVGIAFPDAAGTFLFGGLPAGNYFARTEGTGYFDELWDDKPCALKNCAPMTVTPIVVTANATAVAHFVLEPGGAVAGTLTEVGTGLPIRDGAVRIHRANGTFLGVAFPDNLGRHRYGGLETGSCLALTDDTGYGDELWNDRPCPQGACTVTTGDPIAGSVNATSTADFALGQGGRIEGTLTEDGTGRAIDDGYVRIYTAAGTSLGIAFPDAGGRYVYGGLAAGTYYARTESTGSIDELWNDHACAQAQCTPTSGTPIPVAATGTTTIDFVLAGSDVIFGNGFQ